MFTVIMIPKRIGSIPSFIATGNTITTTKISSVACYRFFGSNPVSL
jgi:hypothetical protein